MCVLGNSQGLLSGGRVVGEVLLVGIGDVSLEVHRLRIGRRPSDAGRATRRRQSRVNGSHIPETEEHGARRHLTGAVGMPPQRPLGRGVWTQSDLNR